ncbi:hypothetical protein Tco_1412089, partial [Tanacetum coccineum]
ADHMAKSYSSSLTNPKNEQVLKKKHLKMGYQKMPTGARSAGGGSKGYRKGGGYGGYGGSKGFGVSGCCGGYGG